MKFLSVVGTRPNFMKLAPLARQFALRANVEHVVVHTGQHYDAAMSDTFFHDLGLVTPQYSLSVGSGSHATQTAAVLARIEPVLIAERPDMVLVYGDVNSTVAAALAAAKMNLPVGHVEAGLRSRDRTMPEELNRLVTDQLSSMLFTPSPDASENLQAEGVPASKIHFVGNIMIDELIRSLPAVLRLKVPSKHQVESQRYVVATLHRPSNVDDPERLCELVATLIELGRDRPVLFPVHPRTRAHMRALGIETSGGGALRLLEPLGYSEMLGLVASAEFVVTDSGGLQEETSYLGVPCLTVRPNTERPITCTEGTNRLVPPNRETIVQAAREALASRDVKRKPIERWDGRTAERIAEVLCEGQQF